MRRPSKTPHGMVGSTCSAHPDFHSMSLYAPLPAAHPVSTSPTNILSDASDRGIVSSSTTYPVTSSSDSEPNGTSSDSDRANESSRDGDSGGSDDGDRNSLEERGGGSDDLNSLAASLQSNKIVGGATQGMLTQPQLPVMVGPGAAASGLPAPAVPASGVGQQQQQSTLQQTGLTGVAVPPSSQPNVTLPLTAPLTAANLAAASQPNVTLPFTAPLTAVNLTTVNQLPATPLTAPLTAANLSAVNQLPVPQPPLTATNLNYLTLQNQLIQSQATIAQLLAYQQQMGLPPMPAPAQPPANAGEQAKQQGE